MIRSANKWDLPAIKSMMREYHRESGWTFIEDDEDYLDRMLNNILGGMGRILIADLDGPVGMIISMRVPLLWNGKQLIEQEAAFWVDPDYRGTRLAYQLLKYYSDNPLSECIGQTLSTRDPEEFSPERHGYRTLDFHYIRLIDKEQ